MKKLNRTLCAAAAALCLLCAAGPAIASSHREAPAIALDPAADNTDLWAWATKDHSKLYVVAAFNPLEEPAGGPNFNKFADEVLYEIRITPGNSNVDKYIYQFRFKTTPIGRVNVADQGKGPGGGKEFFAQLSGQTQSYSVVRITTGDKPDQKVLADNVPVAPVNIGPRTTAVLKTGPYNDAFAAGFIKPTSEGGRVWAGPRDDGFYVDLGGVFDLATLRPKGTAQDGVNHFNCHAIAIEIPTTALTADGKIPSVSGDASTVGVWASASRRQTTILTRSGGNITLGPWVQVSRQGLPLINEAVIGLQDKDMYNRTRPSTDVQNFGAYFLNPIIVRDAEVVGIYKDILQFDAGPYKTNRSDILDAINLKSLPNHNVPLSGTGDLLRVDMVLDPATHGFPNGRPLGAQYTGLPANQENDVTDIILSLFLTKLTAKIGDGVDYNDADYLNDMPFLALPWEGLTQGHGKPTP